MYMEYIIEMPCCDLIRLILQLCGIFWQYAAQIRHARRKTRGMHRIVRGSNPLLQIGLATEGQLHAKLYHEELMSRISSRERCCDLLMTWPRSRKDPTTHRVPTHTPLLPRLDICTWADSRQIRITMDGLVTETYAVDVALARFQASAMLDQLSRELSAYIFYA